MKLPSVSYIIRNAAGTFLRFPAAVVAASVGTICAIILVSHEAEPSAQWLLKVCFAASLGIPLLMTSVVVAERRGWNTAPLQAAGVLAIAVYGILLPSDISSAPFAVTYRHLMFIAAAHLFASFAPYLGDAETSGFWQYNKTLLMRLLQALFFSHVLWVGLSVALLALDKLFGIEIRGERYAQLWMGIAGIFNTWFFLAGVPGRAEAVQPYPRGLKVFTQYVLLPLVAVYLLILYAYAGKIVVEWKWPEGWVSMLILGFSTTGILALLLVYPLKEAAENRWIRALWKWYYIILVPLVVMLLLAAYRRVAEYGITENRYVGLGLGLWLAGITLYFIVSRRKNIKVIPISLCVLGFGCAWGPWGAFSVSERSQRGRLESLLERNGVLVEGKIRPAQKLLPFEDAREVNSIVRYIVSTHGTETLQPWFSEQLDSAGEARGRAAGFEKSGHVVALMGIEQVADAGMSEREFATPATATAIEGYAFLAAVGVPPASYEVPGHGTVSVESCRDSLAVVIRMTGPPAETLSVDLRTLCAALAKPRGGKILASDDMTVESAGTRLRAKVVLSRLRCPRQHEQPGIWNISGIALIGFSQQ